MRDGVGDGHSVVGGDVGNGVGREEGFEEGIGVGFDDGDEDGKAVRHLLHETGHSSSTTLSKWI